MRIFVFSIFAGVIVFATASHSANAALLVDAAESVSPQLASSDDAGARSFWDEERVALPDVTAPISNADVLADAGENDATALRDGVLTAFSPASFDMMTADGGAPLADVPEPASLAMVLGAMGFLAWRANSRRARPIRNR